MEQLQSSGTPLQCSLCPSAPQFCDISHLLTHVGSKGHLSHQHKLGIRGQSDLTARLQLQHYQEWYSENGIQKLLADRLAIRDSQEARDNRKIKKQRAIDQTAIPASQEESTEYDSKALYNPFRIIDPSVLEPLNESFLESPIDQLKEEHQSGVPRKHLWSTIMRDPETPSLSPPNLLCHSVSWEKEKVTETVRTHQDESSLPLCQWHFSRRSNQPCPYPFTNLACYPVQSKDSFIESKIVSEVVHPARRLKGIYWPGMDLFDAATSEMRRKRNQKKDPSVLERMQNDSELVEAKESVYQANGTFLRTKLFSEDDMEDLVNSSKRNSKRAVLGKKSTNVKQNKSKKRAKSSTKAPSHNPTLIEPLIEFKDAAVGSSKRESQKRSESEVLDNEYLELSLTLGQCLGQKKRALTIFAEPYNVLARSENKRIKTNDAFIEDSGEDPQTFGNPRGLKMLNSSMTQMSYGQPCAEDDPSLSSFLNPRDVNRAQNEKENIEPILTKDGKIEDNGLLDQKIFPDGRLDESGLAASLSTSFSTRDRHMDHIQIPRKKLRPSASALAPIRMPPSFPLQQIYSYAAGEDFQQSESAIYEAMVTQAWCLDNASGVF